MKEFACIIHLAVLCAVGAAHAETLAGPVPARLERVIDGDTVKVRVAIWIDQALTTSVRVAGIDAPELFRLDCALEKQKAIAAKNFVEEFLGNGDVMLHDIKRGKYAGRVVARIEARGADLGAALVEAGFATSEESGAWCGSV